MTHITRVKVKQLTNGNNYGTQVLEDLPDSDFDLSDDILASIPMSESTISYNENNICTNSVFNNCTINFVVKKWIVPLMYWLFEVHYIVQKIARLCLHFHRVKLMGKKN